jgi:hypothetical protein
LTISISASLLTSYYDARYGITGASTPTTAASKTAAPTPPWQSTSTAPQQSALVKSVLSGSSFFNPSATQLTAPQNTDAADYKNLFALYQGVNALQGLATDASATGVTASQLTAYQTAFTAGMTQLQTFLGQTSFKSLDVTQGTLTATDQTKEGSPEETDTYTTGTVYSGSPTDPVPAFQGDVSFAMTLTNTNGVGKTVNFNLNDMGSTPRTMGNVVNYLNTQLANAGATTRFKDVDTPGVPETTMVNGKSVTLSTPPDSYALQIVGTSTEAVTFSAPTTTPAVYVTASSGTAAAAATSLTAAVTGDQTQQLIKFNAADSNPTTAVTDQSTLQSAVQSALASATGPDGSVYVVANINGTTADGQTINGSQDVALQKYDSAGNLVYTRTLGAENSATGYAIAVSADGSSVAVAGSVTGALDPNDPGESATSTNSFVSEYNTAVGSENWTTTQASNAGDAATGVAFGSNGSVYVTGTTQSALPNGGGEIGGQDGYLRSYSAAGTLTSNTQFGTTGTDKPAGIAVSGSSIYVAGSENGDAVVRQFTIQPSGAPTAGTVRDLGSLQGGNVVGVGVNIDGSVVVAGSTHNGVLGGERVTNAYQGGREGFVASLGANLQPASTDSVAYVQTSGDLTASAMTLSGGKVYLAGSVAITPPAGSGLTNTTSGYVAAINPSTGGVTWSQQFQGVDDKAAPTSIAVAANGSSVLDQLGLPTAVTYAEPTTLVDTTSLRPGDSFSVQVGSGTPQKITISATDTLRTLATEIGRATGYQATITTPTVNGETQLKIAPLNNAAIKFISGPAGADALTGLGLTAGEISTDVGQTSTASHTAKVTLGLNLPTGLNLSSAASIKTATTALALASAKIQNAYQSLANPTSSAASTTSQPSQYITNQIANYQSALSWLQNNEGATTSTASILF